MFFFNINLFSVVSSVNKLLLLKIKKQHLRLLVFTRGILMQQLASEECSTELDKTRG